MGSACRVVVLHLKSATPAHLKCLLRPCKPLSADLESLLPPEGETSIYGNWSYVPPVGLSNPPPNPLTVLHALAGEGGPDLRLLPDTEDIGAREAFHTWHHADLSTGRCMVVRFPTRDLELVLVPVMTKTGITGTPGPVYWGYTVPANLLPVVACVIHAGKLAVVFDIDETLLMAHTVDSLQTRLQRIKCERDARAAELAAAQAAITVDEALVQALQAARTALKAEQELLRKDFEMLSFFKQDPACRALVDGQIIEPSWESAVMSSGVDVTRPVVRLQLDGRLVILTRIFPESRSTSLLIRLRPGWEALRDYLCGDEGLRATGVKKERWEVLLCTTAEREYAWEAWRLLDPKASLFPLAQLSWRMLCVAHPQKKDLLNVLRKQDIDAAGAAGWPARCPSDPQLITDKMRASRPRVGGPVPLCIVVDDRLDVWEEDSRKAVLQVMPFHPHKEASALDLGHAAPSQQYQQALDSEQELLRVCATLKDVRSATYQTLDKEVKPEAVRLTSTGVMDQLQDTAASILTTLLAPIKSVPQLLAESPHQPPAALGSTDKDDRASDLRLLVHDATMMDPAAANGNGAQQQQQQQAGPPGAAPAVGDARSKDPRKRLLAAATSTAAGAQQGDAAAGAAAAACGGGGGCVHNAGPQDEQQQQQQRAKRRKKEKVKLFGGVDLASIMTTIGNDQEGPQPPQPPQQQQQAVDVLSGNGSGKAAAAAGGGVPARRISNSCSSELKLDSDDEPDASSPVVGPGSRACQPGSSWGPAAAAAAGGFGAGGADSMGLLQDLEQQQQHMGYDGFELDRQFDQYEQLQPHQQQQQPHPQLQQLQQQQQQELQGFTRQSPGPHTMPGQPELLQQAAGLQPDWQAAGGQGYSGQGLAPTMPVAAQGAMGPPHDLQNSSMMAGAGMEMGMGMGPSMQGSMPGGLDMGVGMGVQGRMQQGMMSTSMGMGPAGFMPGQGLQQGMTPGGGQLGMMGSMPNGMQMQQMMMQQQQQQMLLRQQLMMQQQQQCSAEPALQGNSSLQYHQDGSQQHFGQQEHQRDQQQGNKLTNKQRKAAFRRQMLAQRHQQNGQPQQPQQQMQQNNQQVAGFDANLLPPWQQQQQQQQQQQAFGQRGPMPGHQPGQQQNQGHQQQKPKQKGQQQQQRKQKQQQKPQGQQQQRQPQQWQQQQQRMQGQQQLQGQQQRQQQQQWQQQQQQLLQGQHQHQQLHQVGHNQGGPQWLQGGQQHHQQQQQQQQQQQPGPNVQHKKNKRGKKGRGQQKQQQLHRQ